MRFILLGIWGWVYFESFLGEAMKNLCFLSVAILILLEVSLKNTYS